jgi:ATP-dependent DNA helicase Q4
MLRTQVRCRAVLALTATATSSTAEAVASVLDIPPEGVIRDDSVRSNLRLSVSHSNGGAPARPPR